MRVRNIVAGHDEMGEVRGDRVCVCVCVCVVLKVGVCTLCEGWVE